MEKRLKNAVYISVFAALAFIFAILISAPIFEKFVPRSVIFKNPVLTFLQASTSVVIALCSLGMGLYNWNIYRSIRNKIVPFKGFAWMYAIRSFSLFLIFGITFVNTFVAYYWIDTIFRIIGAMASINLLIAQIEAYPAMKEVRHPDDYETLLNKLDETRAELEELKRTI